MLQGRVLVVLNSAAATECDAFTAARLVRAIGYSTVSFLLLLPLLFQDVETDVGPRWEKKRRVWMETAERARALARRAALEVEAPADTVEVLETCMADRREVARFCGRYDTIVYCDSVRQFTRRFRVTILDEILKLGRPTLLVPCSVIVPGVDVWQASEGTV
jgi:hypothetical protein